MKINKTQWLMTNDKGRTSILFTTYNTQNKNFVILWKFVPICIYLKIRKYTSSQ